ncbi:MAG: DUF86 domain-containing protein [Phycisphaerales bacterium]|nr:DUF86 domain-containing protein [Phycisphaerales bacterium]
MLDHARSAIELSAGRYRKDLDEDYMFCLAMTRLIEIIGEAASKVNREFREAHPQIEWTEIIGMRHRIIHAYDRVDLNVLWDAVELDVPPLIEQLERMLQQ